MSAYEIIVSEAFAKEMKKLEPQLRERIKKKLRIAAENPFAYFEKLQGSELFKLRVGKHRIIAQISVPKKQITALSVGHRKNVYDKL